MGEGCSNCAQLESKLAAARREIERLQARIKRLQRVIQLARAACLQWIEQTREVLAQKNGVPRGQWAFAKGAYAVAVRLLAILSSGGDGV